MPVLVISQIYKKKTKMWKSYKTAAEFKGSNLVARKELP